ncbi:MAG: ABC transporter permease subunit, partial [Actinomycetales bacterium]
FGGEIRPDNRYREQQEDRLQQGDVRPTQGFVVTGAITVETVFSWPGLGLLTYEALRGPDIPLLQAVFLLFSVAVIGANLAAELIYVLVDPRVRS